MSFRTPSSILNREGVLGLARIKDQIAHLQAQISTGRRIVNLSDDPAGAGLLVDLNATVKANEQYKKQINDALAFQRGSEVVISSMHDGITRLMELAQESLNSQTTGGGRVAIASEVDGIRSTFLGYANQKIEGKYIFAGTQTQTQPFNGPSAGPITYAGDSNLISVAVGPSATATMNIPGNGLFFGTGGQGSTTDVFQQVTDLRDALLANNVAGIKAAYANLQGIQGNLSTAITDLGGRQGTLENLSTDLDSFNLSIASIKSNVEDVDYAKAVTDFTAAQTAQQAAMSTLAKTNNQNLFDFLT